MIDLSKSSTLADPAGATPKQVQLTLSYRVAQQAKTGGGALGRFASRMANTLTKVDLDLLALCFNAGNQVISVAGPHDLSPFPNGSVRHGGDTAAKGGGNASETIIVHPADIPTSVTGVILAVVAYGNSELFGKLSQVVLTLADGEGKQLAEEYLSIEGGIQGQLLVVLRRDGSGWTIAPFIRPVGSARAWEDVAAAARTALASA
jgi:stress response protein SCP2